MSKQQVGQFLMPVAYAVAGGILVIGFVWIILKTGLTYLTNVALEAE